MANSLGQGGRLTRDAENALLRIPQTWVQSNFCETRKVWRGACCVVAMAGETGEHPYHVPVGALPSPFYEPRHDDQGHNVTVDCATLVSFPYLHPVDKCPVARKILHHDSIRLTRVSEDLGVQLGKSQVFEDDLRNLEE